MLGTDFHVRCRQPWRLCDASSLGEVAQDNEQKPGLVFIFQCSFEVLGGKIRVLPEPPNDGLVVRDAGLRFMGFRSFLNL